MPSTVAIRLADEDRATLEQAAKDSGLGISTYVRRLAERQASRIRTERVQAETGRIAAVIAANPEVAAEAELLSGDGEDWPRWLGPLPG